MRPLRNLALVVWLLSCVSLEPRTARADGAQQPGDVDEAGLERALDFFASDQHRARVRAGWAEVAEAAVVLPPGILLTTRSDAELQLVGVGLIVTGSQALLDAPNSLLPGFMERVRAHHARRRATQAAGAAFYATREEWAEEVVREHRLRPFWGVMNLAAGGVFLATGMILLLAKPGILGLGRQTQYTLGSVLVPIGLRGAWDGLCLLTSESYEQRAWNIYEQLRTETARGGRDAVVFSVGPTERGVAGSVTLAF
jgi:hypothetical protein